MRHETRLATGHGEFVWGLSTVRICNCAVFITCDLCHGLRVIGLWHPRREGRPKSQNFVHILDCSPPSFIILFHHPPLLPPSGHPLTTVVTNHRNNNPFQTHVWFTYPPLIGCTTIQLRQEENGTELTNKSPPTQAGSGAATVGTHTKNHWGVCHTRRTREE